LNKPAPEAPSGAAAQKAVAQFVQAEQEEAFKDIVENTHPVNNTEIKSSDKISAAKKKRMKKKAAKAAKAGQGNSNGEEDDVSDVSPLADTKKEFVEVVSANQSYEAYYSADSESQADIVGRHMLRR
jgi:hypothetical protein